MNRRPVEWLPRPDLEDDDAPSEEQRLDFRLAADWVAVDADQLILPIVVIWKTGVRIEDSSGYRALLKQYGGEGLLNDMLLSDQLVEEGSEWRMIRYENRLTVEPLDRDDTDD